MTAIFYSDCKATSPKGKFTLEARSPHNGTINHRDGQPPAENEFGFKYREHQSNFRYRLIDNTRQPSSGQMNGSDGGFIVWERWQEDDEDSPHELVVSDDGWSILRTHGFRPELIAVSPVGEDTLRVRIDGAGSEHAIRSGSIPVYSWSPDYLEFSSAGLYWTEHSWRFFFPHQGSFYFAWRTSCGQCLLLNLSASTLLPTPDSSDPLSQAMIEGEKQGVIDLLSSFTERMNEVRNWFRRGTSENTGREEMDPQVRFLTAAFHLAGVHRLTSAIPLLRKWEEIDCRSRCTGSDAMPGSWWLEVQCFRPILHHSLRLLGQEPLGYATYHFTPDFERRFPMPEHVPNRQAKTAQVRPEMTAEQVLQLLGSPDHIQSVWRQEGEIHRTSEHWEYDFLSGDQWTTFRITWEEKKRDRSFDRKNRPDPTSQITQIETEPSSWLHTDKRVSNILRG
ncbi:hypothetical protein [Zavarzinella formosa]|uniref:hypothetical protein n=1 Tax=Zavarzinella formosa TaxID=360055 RepID=UPI0002D4F7D3|nr:hypothetical protein [Zavarzinella formosa]